MKNRNPLRIFWLILGLITFVAGSVGVIIPVLPTFPFYVVAAFSFAKSSKRLHDYFVGTRLYKKHMERFIRKRQMTIGTKICTIASVTVVMGIGFVFMHELPIGRMILAGVWVAHIFYFGFRVKTADTGENKKYSTGSEQDG